MEIERKWKLLTVPPITEDSKWCIFQKYLCSGEIEVRVRRAVCMKQGREKPMSPYLLTIKGPGSLSRQEVNIKFDKNNVKALDDFETLYDLVGERAIIKDFYTYFYNGYRIDVSIVDQQYIYAEVEFESEEAANKFVWPWPGAIEVTQDPRHKMKNYWNRTRLNYDDSRMSN